jgi:choline dehydrogenase-like flavoprotein
MATLWLVEPGARRSRDALAGRTPLLLRGEPPRLAQDAGAARRRNSRSRRCPYDAAGMSAPMEAEVAVARCRRATTGATGRKAPAGSPLALERARVLAGCSTHNGCTQNWGWRGDYDAWGRHSPGWSADELAPAFARARTAMRLRHFTPEEIQPFQAAFVEACGATGHRVADDLDDLDGGPGAGCSPVNIVDGLRWNTAVAYLDAVRERPGLRILDRTEVERLEPGGDGPYDLHVYPWIEPDAAAPHGWKCVFPVALLVPRSRGAVLSGGAVGRARIEHRHLSDPTDAAAIAHGVRALRPILAQPALATLLGSPQAVPPADDPVALEAYIRRHHAHYWHPGASCPMGPDPAEGAVVDERARLHGLPAIRIADASIFPSLPRATTAMPTTVVGERVAELMLA